MKTISSLLAILAVLAFTSAFNPSAVKDRGVKVRGGPLQMTLLSYGGKKKDFKAGSPLKSAAAGLGVKPKYSCKKGDCGSCTISVGGQRIKACVGKVPPEPKLKSLQEKGLEIR